MELTFKLISSSTLLYISEPVGFDRFESEIKRNDMHGASLEFSDIELEFFDCAAVDLITSKYNENIDNEIDFVVELRCNSLIFNEIYRGRLDLGTCRFLDKKYKSIVCKVGQIGVLTTFNNRINTDVCVDDLISIDGSDLADYDFINHEIDVPGKEIIVIAKCNDYGCEAEYLPVPYTFEGGTLYVIYVPGMINSEGDNLGNFNYSSPNIFRAKQQNEMLPFFELKNNGIGASHSDLNGTFEFKLRVEADAQAFSSTYFLPNAVLEIYDEFGNTIIEDVDTRPNQVTTGDDFTEYHYWGYISLTKKSFRKLYMRILFRIHIASLVSLESYSMKVLPISNSNFTIKTYSVFSTNNVKVNLLHETLSRISESISNNEIKVWSDYYGRPDSFNGSTKPYPPQSAFGIGSLRCLTNGYKLRNYKYTDGSNPKMYISMKKLIQSLAAIDNIGCGFYRAMNEWWFRVENWKWFYQNEELFVIENTKIERAHNLDETFTRLKIGYKKYADLKEANVVDTFHSERNYSTHSKVVDKEINVLSDFVADPYVIEYTRRKAVDKDTKDWQYDEDIFILCLMRVREINESGGVVISDETIYKVDNGMEATGNSVISPETMQNVYISPARNALNWADRFSQYAGVNGLSYLSGTRNTNAKGKAYMRNNPTITQSGDLTVTRWYNQNYDSIVVEENKNIAKYTPKLKAQLLKFDYPISIEQYNFIRLNPYGYILVNGEKCWIKSVKYGFKTGMTKFELIPEWK